MLGQSFEHRMQEAERKTNELLHQYYHLFVVPPPWINGSTDLDETNLLWAVPTKERYKHCRNLIKENAWGFVAQILLPATSMSDKQFGETYLRSDVPPKFSEEYNSGLFAWGETWDDEDDRDYFSILVGNHDCAYPISSKVKVIDPKPGMLEDFFFRPKPGEENEFVWEVRNVVKTVMEDCFENEEDE